MNRLVPAKYLYLFAHFLKKEHQIDLAAICQQHGFSLTEKASDFMDIERFSRACELGLASVDDANIGLKFGSTLSFTHFGPLGAAMMSCNTIKDTLDLIIQFSSSTFPFELSLKEEGEYVNISQYYPDYFNPIILFHIQIYFCGCFHFFKDVAGFIPEDLELHFPYPEPSKSQLAEYIKYLPVPLKFDQKAAIIRLSKSYLKQPLPRYDEISKQVFVNLCQDIQQRLVQQEKLSGQISNLLDAYETYPSIEQLAQVLNISARTLRSRLQKEQTNFREILTSHRLQRAKGLLVQNKLSIERVAEKVGYKDTPSFYRAFKKVNLQTPLEYRELALSKS
ncbi:MAG: helix-turn-helix domain-containing protein [Bermanella sp.]